MAARKALWYIVALGLSAALFVTFADESCAQPFPWDRRRCGAQAQAILNASVRIVFHGWLEVETGNGFERIEGTVSHGTVFDERYLLTHNHFGISLARLPTFNRLANGGIRRVSILRHDGTVILDQASIEVFEVIAENRKSVVLDFGLVAGEGLFAHSGVSSAQLSHGIPPALLPGAEVAVLDGDGQGEARIVWARVESIDRDSDPVIMRVDHCICAGASGGGVFFDGVHVGNNWSRIVQRRLSSGVLREAASLVALNS